MKISDMPDDVAAPAAGIARRAALGGTVWVVSCDPAAYGQPVAAELARVHADGRPHLCRLVHGADLVAATRHVVRAGDVVVTVGPSDDASLAAVCRRGDVWATATVWAGWGPRPPMGAAHHLLWVDASDAEGEAAPIASLLARVRALCERIHAALEDVVPPQPDDDCGDGVCITCSDEGSIAEVAHLLGSDRAGVLAGGRPETVDTGLVPSVRPGDLVLVHAGTAMTVIDEQSW